MATIKLKDISTRAPKEFNKQDTKQKLEKILDELDELQNLLYAEGKHSVLVVLQGVDASGKDSTIRHVFGKLNPLGVSAHPFKVPTPEELAHDFQESEFWERYRKMYEAIFERCDEPPWKIIPADQKWYRDYLVAITVRDALEKLGMKYPSLKE